MPKSKAKTPFKLVTNNGYQLDEIVSMLQKEIRRGHEKQALWCAIELVESGYAKYCWRRLFVISSEDVSISETTVAPQLWSLYQFTSTDVKESSGRTWSSHELLHLAKAIILLSRAKKNRLTDYLLTDIQERRKKGWKLQLADYALDSHCELGRKLRKQAGIPANDYTDFYSESVRLSNFEEIDKSQEYRNNTLKHFNLDNLVSDWHPKVS